jgi:hypothetical protein
MAAARDLPAQAHNRAADNIARTDYRRGPALLQPSATIQPAAPSARKQQAILTPKVPVRMVPGHIRRRRTNRNHDCRPARAPNKPDPPARPNRGATLFYIGNTRHTHARGEDIPVSHQDTHSSPAAEGWSPRPPRHLPPIAAPRAAPGSLAPRWQPPSRPPPTHAGRDRSDWCRPRAPKTNLAANRLRGITHVHQFGTFPTFDPPPETKLLHPADDKLAGEPPA